MQSGDWNVVEPNRTPIQSFLIFVFAGLAIASALIDISQQKPSECKEKTSAVRNRKQLPPTHQGTCV